MTKQNKAPYTPRREIKPGDVVALKSGSQKMVVVEVKDGAAGVVWSDFDSKTMRDALIPTVALVPAS